VRVGFIGLGRMGRPMAENILAAGHTLVVHNRSPEPVAALAARGAVAADTPAASAGRAEVVCLCLPDPEAVRQVVAGPGGLLEAVCPGLTVVDFSTVDPETSRAMAGLLSERGAFYLDAPVSGGTVGARAGTLTVMVGGDGAAFERARPVLEVVGRHITHVGPSGTGSAVKLANQLIVGVTTAAIAEAMVLVARAGVRPDVAAAVLRSGFARSVVLERHLSDFILKGAFEPAFKLELLEKDVRLACDLGRQTGVRLLVTNLVHQVLVEAKALGFGDQDMAAAIRPLERLAGVEVRAPEV